MREYIDKHIADTIKSVLTTEQINEVSVEAGAGNGYGRSLLDGRIYINTPKSKNVYFALLKTAKEVSDERLLILESAE